MTGRYNYKVQIIAPFARRMKRLRRDRKLDKTIEPDVATITRYIYGADNVASAKAMLVADIPNIVKTARVQLTPADVELAIRDKSITFERI